MDVLVGEAEKFESASVRGLLRTAPDLTANIAHILSMYTPVEPGKTITILPTPGADPDCDEADEAIEEIKDKFESLRQKAVKLLG